MTACADKLLLLHGFVDGELDAANSLALEAHLRSCAGCSEELGRIDAVHVLLASAALKHRTSSDLQARIRDAIVQADGPEPRHVLPTPANRNMPGGFWSAAQLLVGMAAGLALALWIPQSTPPVQTALQDELVANHVRSLMVGHLTDVPTSDKHVVKPWFNGKIDFSPPVPNLAEAGFPLMGGRLDYVEGRVVPAIIYHRRLHRINLFVKPAGPQSLPRLVTTHHEGFNIVRWQRDGLEYWAVSDLNMKELQQFQALYDRG